MSKTMDFLWSLIGRGFDSWNTTYRMEEFSLHVPGFDYLETDIQEQVVTNLDTKDLGELYFVWSIRDKVFAEWPDITFTDFVDIFILNPNATDTLLPLYVPTAAEYCQYFEQELILIQSIIMLIPSTIVLLILMFFKPRTNLCKGCLWGRPSLLVPINFIDEHGRRWAYCGAFAIMTSFLLDFFDQELFWNPGNWQDEEWTLRFSWIRPFILLGNVIHLGYLFYPLFACLSLRRLIPANILGLAYAAFWVYLHVDEVKACPIEPKRGDTQLGVEEITRIVTVIPIFLGEIAVVFAFILDLVINSYRCHLKRTNQANKYKPKSRWGGKETLPLQYIEYLMTAHREKPTTLKAKIKRMFVYTNVLGFKYPPRVICTMCVAFILLLSLTINLGTELDQLLIPLEQEAGVTSTLGALLDVAGNLTDPNVKKALDQAPRYISGIRGCIIFANVVASLLHFGSMVHMIRTYRTVWTCNKYKRSTQQHSFASFFTPEDLGHIILGSRSPLMKNDANVYGMRYSGYQIAYLLWGYVIMFVLVTILSIALTVAIIIPLTFGEKPFFFNKLIIAISTAVGTVLINRAQTMIAKFGFLQERGAHLALTNRHAYHIMSYFIFFFNIVVGAFSVIRRSLLSMLFGTLLLCRLDRCLLMRGFERFDAGFSAYMGMLEVDATHNHPVLKGFIYILKAEVKDSKERHQDRESNGDAEKGVVINGKPTRRFDKRIRNKWWKLITLVNNPVLVIERLQRKVQEERQKKHDLRDDVVDMIATTAAVFMGGAALGAASGIQNLADHSTFGDDILASTQF